ncbi:MAG: outer membrane protein transport protein [Acidobacteriota bacterium]|nr:outer membrane protein transport protein [Acidobacteriota bacterium]
MFGNWKKLMSGFILSFVFLTGTVSANGLNLNGLGGKAVSMGGAFTGLADDFSLVYWNPAGAGFLSRPLFGASATDLMPTNRYEVTFEPETSIAAKTKFSHYLGFLVAYYQPVSERLTLGVGFYTPSKFGTNWKGEDFKPITNEVAYDWSSRISLMTLSPLIAWKVTDRISLGVTFNLNYGEMKMSLWPGELEISPGVYADPGQYEEGLHGFGWGLTFGLLAKPVDWLSFGLTVKTPSAIKFRSKVNMYDLSAIGYPVSSEVRREIKWPWFIGGGVSIKPVEKLTLNADLQWSGWSKLKNITTCYLDPLWADLMAANGADVIPLNWEDVWQVRFGAEYRLSQHFALRAGYYLDPAAGPDETLNVLLPTFDCQGITVGFGYDWKGLSISWGFEYLSGKNRQAAYELGADDSFEPVMPGTYKMYQVVPSVSVSYKF